MAKVKRACDKCGKTRVFRNHPEWGGICRAGHYICWKCRRKSLLWILLDPFALLGIRQKKKCPVCRQKLRNVKKADLA